VTKDPKSFLREYRDTISFVMCEKKRRFFRLWLKTHVKQNFTHHKRKQRRKNEVRSTNILQITWKILEEFEHLYQQKYYNKQSLFFASFNQFPLLPCITSSYICSQFLRTTSSAAFFVALVDIASALTVASLASTSVCYTSITSWEVETFQQECHTRFQKAIRMRTMYVPGLELTYTTII
jgi:hypothetical protein